MATNTTNYSFKKPTVSGDSGVWGGYLNDNWESTDQLLGGESPITGIDINSGTIDGAVIGGAAAGAGSFTTLSASTSFTLGGTAITATGVELNYVDGVTSAIQTQLDAKLATPGSTTGSGALVYGTSPTLVTPVLGTPSSGNLSGCTADGTDAVGFKNIPQQSKSADYTLVLADAGKHIFHPSGDASARTYTIPANASVAYPIGTAVVFVNMTAEVVSIAITSDTMYLAKDGTTGTRSLARYGSATALKMTATTWLISGSALS